MCLVFQGLSLLFTICVSVLRVGVGLPRILLNTVVSWFSPFQSRPQKGCVFYEGNVFHHRRQPVDHQFSYPLRLALIDLDEAPDWFRDQSKDHWSSEECRIKAGTEGKVKLLTNPACCNYIQNPISVYYCFSASNRLEKCIAEVTNTPWGARVNFVFDPSGDRMCKALHVSPFMDMDSEWLLETEMNDERLSLSVRCRHPIHGNFFDAIMHLKRSKTGNKPNEQSGLRALLRYGFLPQRVALWIYWQAVCLFRKGVPFHGYPDTREIKTKAEKESRNLKFTTGKRFIWRDPKSYPWSVYA